MCYKIDSNGINPTPIMSKQKETFITEGSLKVSPNGKYIALADYDVAISLYNFNNKNAEILFIYTPLNINFYLPLGNS